MNDKIIIFGKGYLGQRIAESFGCQVTDTNPLEIGKLHAFLEKENPDVVINAIGRTGRPNIDWCEDNIEETLLSNVSAAINLGAVCSKKGIYFVHLGSGCIYYGDNNSQGYSEEDKPNFYGPQFYAKTKIMAEMALSELPSLILRIRMPLDEMDHERNLINKLKKYEKLSTEENSITTVPHMIHILRKMIIKRCKGVYNLVNPGKISAYEIMEIYNEVFEERIDFKPMSIEELDSLTKGKRSNCILNNSKLESEGFALPDVRRAIKECLKKYKAR